MSGRLRRLLRGGWAQIAIALTLGYAFFTVADNVAGVLVGVLSQHVSSPSAGMSSPLGLLNLYSGAPFFLNFHIGHTVIVYGYALITLVALGLVLLGRAAVNAYVRRDQLPCPHCLTWCPIEATVCRACSLEMIEQEPEPA